MECNKEEAVRAMEVAEKKLRDSDYIGARKMAQMAQRLYPELENINRLLAVIEVHYAAENKISGLEYDWYGILQIQPSVDQEAVRKQYRKLALLLHPDKNKFVGAEAAFKLIGEANRLLTDQLKRTLYDVKLRASQNTDPHKLNNRAKRPTKKQNEASNSSQNVSLSQSGGINKPEPQTFWTACPFCNMRFQYLKTYVNRMLRCQSCCRVFIAHDLGNQNVPHGSSVGHTPAQNIPSDPVPSKVASDTNNSHANMKARDKRAETNDTLKTVKTSEIGSGLKAEQHRKCVNVGMKGSKEGKTSRSGEAKSKGQEVSEDELKKRKRKSAVESDGGDLNRKSDAEFSKSGRRIYVANEENNVDLSRQNSGVIGNSYTRKSPRNKQHYHDKQNCTNDFASQKMSMVSKSSSGNKVEIRDCAGDIGMSNANNFSAHTTVDGDGEEIKQQSPTFAEEGLVYKKRKSGESKVMMAETPVTDHSNTKTQKVDCDTGSMDGEKINIIDAPQPDFSDFDKDRTENIFAANQMWVVYDINDSMPRFYCIVRKVLFPGFKLKITWLEPNPVNKEERDWCNVELPVACGKFKLGEPQDTSDILMFSHLKNNILRHGRGSYLIYPCKGETWALFKDWDIRWSSNPASHVLYKYEFVEVLSDFDVVAGIEVAYLCKVTGFVSLFQRSKVSGGDSFKIPLNELYRFSHQVPSHVMTGEERDGVPKGSFELDTAGLPLDFFEAGSACDVKLENGGVASEASSLSAKSPEKEVASEKIEVAKEQERDDSGRGASMLRQNEKGSKEMGVNQSSHVNPNQNMSQTAGCKESNGNISSCKESATAEKPRTGGNKPGAETESVLRRSPRDLRKKCSEHEDVSEEFSDQDIIKSENIGDSRRSFNSSERDSSAKISINYSPSKFPGSKKVISTPIHDFNGEKSGDKFDLNQIWAMYNDRDGMPTVYVQVKKIEANPSYLLHVTFLEPFPQPKDPTNQPCFGAFKVKDSKMKALSTSSFSHCLSTKPIGKDKYEIYPWKGEIWAVYKKNLNSELQGKREEYDIVEVVENGDQATTVAILTRLREYQSVYRPPRIQRSKSRIIDVPRHDLARFSHQIPAFRHTGETNKSLKGCWELDSSAIPGSLLV